MNSKLRCVDNQRTFVPPADGVPLISTVTVLRVLTPIHIDCPRGIVKLASKQDFVFAKFDFHQIGMIHRHQERRRERNALKCRAHAFVKCRLGKLTFFG